MRAIGGLEQHRFSRIPLYLNADAPPACALHEALTLNVAKRVFASPLIPTAGRWTPFYRLRFGRTRRCSPDSGSFSGYQLLLEYFTFREKFMSVERRGLESVDFPEEMPWFEIEVVLDTQWQHEFTFRRNICGCTAHR